MRHINHYFIHITIFIAGLAFTHIVAAEKLEVQVGTGLMAFNYTEYDDNNIFLDGETGLIPGIVLKLKNKMGSSYTEWVGSAYYNTIKYDGQTQSGIPVVTDSDAFITDAHVKLGQNFDHSYGRDQSIYFGLGYRYWLRNIRSGYTIYGDPVSGLLEEYHWFYGLAGYAVHFNSSANVRVGLDLRLTQMFNAEMDVAFGGYDKITVNLGNKLGARLAVPIEIKSLKSSLFVTPYYEILDIGKSNTVTVTSGGVPQGFAILEPRSETRNLGVELTWLW